MLNKPFVVVFLLFLSASLGSVVDAQSTDCDSFLLEHLHPILDTLPNASFEDLEPVRQMVGSSKIVALGDATRGSHETVLIKHRLIRFLIEEMGFNTIALESNGPETYLLNEYLQTGEGRAKKLLRELRVRMLYNPEMLEIVQYLREHNKTQEKQVHLLGFDMQNHKLAVENIENFIERYDSTLSSTFSYIQKEYALENKERNYGRLQPKTDAFFQLLKDKRKEYPSRILNSVYDWALYNANLLAQHAGFMLDNQAFILRDQSMADNIEWIIRHREGAKVVVWSHNTHIDQLPFYSMGNVLATKYKDDYFTLGFALHTGSYAAVGSDNILSNNNVLETPSEKTYEHLFKGFGHPFFLLDLRNGYESGCKWLSGKLKFRELATNISGKEFIKTDLSGSFDAIFYIEKTTPTRQIY